MKLFSDLKLKFENPDWSKNPEFGLIDSILEKHPEIIKIASNDFENVLNQDSKLGRQDKPTAEQIVRAGIYKEMKGYDYRELEYAQSDSRICATFIKLDERKPYCFQLFQKYISLIKSETLQKILLIINKTAIEEGFEDVEQIRQDTTVVKSNIHYPTDNSLLWDCIKESHRLLKHLKEEEENFSYRDYKTSAKKTYYKINNTKGTDKREELFRKQLITFTKCINQLSNTVKKNYSSIGAFLMVLQIEEHILLMQQAKDIVYRRMILKETVANDEKIISIYERHADIIVKGSRDVLFGHKIILASGKSNLILDCDVPRGNPSDKLLYQPTVERIISAYDRIPRDSVTDGGFASKDNMEYSVKRGIVNTVFNKVVGSLQNVVSSKNIETRLMKWRSGIEAVISNLKRGFNLQICNWKGWEHFKSKVLWSVIGYNFRVLTNLVLQKLTTELV
jgi:transposase, IS5 family